MKSIINWKVFWILLAAAIIATILLLPYALEVQSSAIDLTKLPIPWPLVLTLQVAQNAILFAIAIFGGLFSQDVSVSEHRSWIPLPVANRSPTESERFYRSVLFWA